MTSRAIRVVLAGSPNPLKRPSAMAATWCCSGRTQLLSRLATLVPPRRTTTASAARRLRAGLVLAQSGYLPREPGAWAGPLGSDVRLPILTQHIVL